MKAYEVQDGVVRIPIDSDPSNLQSIKRVEVDESGRHAWVYGETAVIGATGEDSCPISPPLDVGDTIKGVEEWGEVFHVIGSQRAYGGYVYRGDVSKNVQDNINGEWNPASTCPQPREYEVTGVDVEEMVSSVDTPAKWYRWKISVKPKEQK